MAYSFPSRLPGLLKLIVARYRFEKSESVAALVEAGRWGVDLGVVTDNWNGGEYGHDVIVYLPLELLATISTESRSNLCKRLKEDLNSLITRSNEYVYGVHLELADENDAEYQAALEFQSRPSPDPTTLGFWKQGLVRCFITHRDEHKAAAHRLGSALEEYGFSCFVAHDTVIPMREWRREIMFGLQTMEIMVVFLTDDFHDSTWTNQEVGFALGSNRPVVCLKLGKRAPQGFVDHIQAVAGDLSEPESAAANLYPHLAAALNASDRLNNGLIEAFLKSSSYTDAKSRFDRMTKTVSDLSDEQIARIIDDFNSNDQLYGASYLTNANARMPRWLSRATGINFVLEGRQLKLAIHRPGNKTDQEDIPF